MKSRMPAVECNYHENKLAADRLYNNDEWISTGHAAGLRGKHREECTGETAQRVEEHILCHKGAYTGKSGITRDRTGKPWYYRNSKR